MILLCRYIFRLKVFFYHLFRIMRRIFGQHIQKTWNYFYKIMIKLNAFQLSHVDGQDLYGIDLCIEAFEVVHKKYLYVGFVIALAKIVNQTYFEKLNGILQAKNLHNH